MHTNELNITKADLQADKFLRNFIRQQAMNNAIQILDAKGINITSDKAVYLYIVDKIDQAFQNEAEAYEPKLLKKGIKYIDFKSLVPLAHPTLANFYRVPIKVTKTQYRVYVDKGCVRIFTQATVPPYLLSKLTMAKAASDNTTKDVDLYEYDLFMTKDKNGMADVAWQASESMFTIVLHETELKELQGDKL
jgi:hypothetical protein